MTRRRWRVMLSLGLLLSFSAVLRVSSQTIQSVITTVAGNGTAGYSGDNPTGGQLNLPSGIAINGSGQLIIADTGNNRIRKITANNTISTIAGGGPAVYSDGGLATSAMLASPTNVAFDSAGNMFIADFNSNRIRKVDTAGIITTVAGTNCSGFNGDNVLATTTCLAQPNSVKVDSSGNLYIADTGNHRIRKVNTAGIITTIAGSGFSGFSGDGSTATFAALSLPTDVAIDAAGNVFIADFNNHRIRKVAGGIITTVAGTGTPGAAGDGGAATSAQLRYPLSITRDNGGNLFIADYLNDRVRKVTFAGTITTVAGNGTFGYSGDGGLATAAQLFSPAGVALDSVGNLFIADLDNNRIRKVDTGGIITTAAGTGVRGYNGDGPPALTAQMRPNDVAVDSGGNIYIADRDNHRVRKVTPLGTISTFAGNGTPGFSGDGGLAISAQLNSPSRLAIDETGNVFIADTDNSRVRMVTPGGLISTVAGGGDLSIFETENHPATFVTLGTVSGVAVAADGSLYISDSTRRVRRVDPTGIITTFAGNGTNGSFQDNIAATSVSLPDPQGLAVDSAGNVYIAEKQQRRIRKVNTAGIISTFAGNGTYNSGGDNGPATSASFRDALDVEIDPAGSFLISDTSNNRIRKVGQDGIITTVAGTGSNGFSGDGGSPTSAMLFVPMGTGVDGTGNIFIADLGNYRIRKVAAAPSSLPTIIGISPFFGTQATSISAVIVGTNLSGATAVTFDSGITASLGAGGTSTSLPLNLDISAGASVGKHSFTVTNASGTSQVFSGFTVLSSVPRPSISAITPSRGGIGRTIAATITGTGLAGATSVTFSGTGVTAAIEPGGTATSLPLSITIAPDAVLGFHFFTVTGPGGTSVLNLFMVAQPTVTAISPTVGSIGTTVDMLIAGHYFTGATAVTFSGGGVNASIAAGVTDSHLPISVSIDANAAPGVRQVTVVTSDGTSTMFDGLTLIVAGSDGIITTLAGNGSGTFSGDSSPAVSAGVPLPKSIATDSSGNLFIADSENRRVRKVSATNGTITTVAGNGECCNSGNGGPATQARLGTISGIAVDSSGNLYIAEPSSNTVRKVDAGGTISKFAGTNFGFSGDGGPATSAQMRGPNAVAVDPTGNVYIIDLDRVRKVTLDGNINTIPVSMAPGNPIDIAVDAAGNLYVAQDTYVSKLSYDGIVSTIAGTPVRGVTGDGGPAVLAQTNPSSLAVDSIGNLFIAERYWNHLFTETFNNRIRKVSPAGIITTVAGNGRVGFSGDGGPATLASFSDQLDVAADANGNIFIADYLNNRVRKVTYNLPVISILSPASGAPGTSVIAVIKGVALGGATSISFSGTGVSGTILGGGTPTSVPVSITVAPNAAGGSRSLTITTANGTSPSFSGFTVLVNRRPGQVTSQ